MFVRRELHPTFRLSSYLPGPSALPVHVDDVLQVADDPAGAEVVARVPEDGAAEGRGDRRDDAE